MSIIDIKVISTKDEFFLLKDAWNALLNDNSSYDITLRWEWMFTWWETFFKNRKLFILCAYENECIVALAPFLTRKKQRFGVFGIKSIEFIGTGECEQDEIDTDYLDIIIQQGKEQLAIEAMSDHLVQDDSWDEIILTDYVINSPNIALLVNTLCEFGVRHLNVKEYTCPYVDLPSTWDELAKQTRINSREQLNRKKRLLANAGEVEFLSFSTEIDINEYFPRFVELHQNRWIAADKSGCFSSKLFSDFHARLIDRLLPLNMIRLYFLKVNGAFVAARYCFAYKNRIYDYQTGLDPLLYRKVGPGVVLLALCLEDSIEKKFTIFDFLKGAKGGYKYKWTDKEKIVARSTLRRTCMKCKSISIIEYILDRARSIKHSAKRFLM